MTTRHRYTPGRRWLRYPGVAAGLVLLFVGLFGIGFSIGEAKSFRTPAVVTETETVINYQVPTTCLEALASATDGLELAGGYDDEMRTLHKRDGGMHIFTPGDPGGHYDVAQQHHKELTAAADRFEKHAAQCRGGS